MTTPSTNTTIENAADAAAQATDQVIRSSQRVANRTLDKVADTVDEVRTQAEGAMNRLSGDAERLMRRGADKVRDGSQQLREQALRATDSTAAYVKAEPVKALLIAAAVGAALMALISIGSRNTRD
ncbi:MAG TPA: hypothetical protein VIZ30_07260 [Pseudomonadales bacterium]